MAQFEPMEQIYLLWTPGVEWGDENIMWCDDENPSDDPDIVSTPYIRGDIVDKLLGALRAYEHAEQLNAVYGTEPYDENEDDGDEIFQAFLYARSLSQAALAGFVWNTSYSEQKT